MMEYRDPFYTYPVFWVVAAIQVVTLVHVGWESLHDKRIGNTFWHVGMNMLVCWPLSYLCWIFWWPGTARQALFGPDKDKAREWARMLTRKETEQSSEQSA